MLNNFEDLYEKSLETTKFEKTVTGTVIQISSKGENPGYSLANKYKIDDVVTCKVIKFVPFGAFLEIESGLEGLVHNSEITSLRRVVKPEDELKLGLLENMNTKSI